MGAPRVRRSLAAALLLVACAACGDRQAPAPPVQTEQYLVGAYYYLWYPYNFTQGYLRGKLAPPQSPVLGAYRSSDPATAERHIAWASRHGVDFFALDWWPNRPRHNQLVEKAYLKAANVGDVRFCICYETWDLGFDSVTGELDFDRKKADRFVAELTAIGEKFFDHPSYLKVGGRPVVVLYLTRTFRGGFAEAIARARAALAARGHEVFLVGDEVFWKVSPVMSREPVPLARTPQRSRVRLFDAITGYNLYENERPEQRGYPAGSSFVEDSLALYGRYREAAGDGVYVVPGVIPGYNDRGVRPGLDHYVIPRQWEAGAPEGSTFAGLLDRVGLPLVDPRLNMLLVTTWNEWNEDTAIEPLEPAPATARDASRGGADYTQGYPYAGHGTAYLEVLRDRFVAVAGRVTAANGAPRRGVVVAASRDGRELARGVSDSDGYYRISRLRLPPGPCAVALPGAPAAGARTVEVRAGETALGVDFALAADAAAAR